MMRGFEHESIKDDADVVTRRRATRADVAISTSFPTSASTSTIYLQEEEDV
jgi:hypothetical protein